MLPFLQQKDAARKLDIYSDQSRPNPFNAAELTNNTGKAPRRRPITVYDANNYAGEALVETFRLADKRFISYGVDLGTRLSTNLNSHTDNTRELTPTTALSSPAPPSCRPKPTPPSMWTREPKHSSSSILSAAATASSILQGPSETAREVYRFEVKLAANGKAEFPVTEENV